jgi:pyridoxal biosynthesis lyase PdxS
VDTSQDEDKSEKVEQFDKEQYSSNLNTNRASNNNGNGIRIFNKTTFRPCPACIMILSQHEGAQCLDDTTHIAKDKALRLITNQSVPTPQAIGIWLRRLGKDNQGIKALQKVNKTVLKATLNHCKNITLDIDASEVIANKADAQWTYKKHKGYMPIIGHIAQTGQIVATNFRAGNVSPAKDNLDFIISIL